MAGGCCSFDNVTLTKTGEDFEDLTPVPSEDTQYCIAGIDSNRIFTTGLGPSNKDTYMFSRDTNQWNSLPKMPTGRYGMGCGVARHDTDISVVVVGGDTDTTGYLDRVEIYLVEEGIWASGTMVCT